MGHSAGEITKLLLGWRDGEHKALDALAQIVYKELHHLAHVQLRRERHDDTLSSQRSRCCRFSPIMRAGIRPKT